MPVYEERGKTSLCNPCFCAVCHLISRFLFHSIAHYSLSQLLTSGIRMRFITCSLSIKLGRLWVVFNENYRLIETVVQINIHYIFKQLLGGTHSLLLFKTNVTVWLATQVLCSVYRWGSSAYFMVFYLLLFNYRFID